METIFKEEGGIESETSKTKLQNLHILYIKLSYYSSFVYLVLGPDVYEIDNLQTLWPHNHLNVISGSEGYTEC